MSKETDNAAFNKTKLQPFLQVRGFLPLGEKELDGHAGKVTNEAWDAYVSTLPVVSIPKTPSVKPVPAVKYGTLYLSAGHGGSDSGIEAMGRKEADLAIDLRDRITKKLAVLIPDLTVWNDPNGWATAQTSAHLLKTTSQADTICDLHFNGSNGKGNGVEVIIPKDYSPKELALARNLAKAIVGATGLVLRRDQGVMTETESQHGRLAMMRPPGTNILIENCFLDNKGDIEKFISVIDNVAEVIAKTFVAYYQEG
jgi:N-acetylmuramoyl-L-alanine amidase